MITFNELKIGDYFFFYELNFQIRRKVSRKKYIWIYDGDIHYCKSIEDEESSNRWITKQPHLKKVTKIEFSYTNQHI